MADDVKTSAPHATAKVEDPIPRTWRDDRVASAIHRAFTLGVNLVELRSRITLSASQVNAANAADAADAAKPLVEESLWLASQWRAVYGRIVATHAIIFPDSTTADTLYEPPGKDRVAYLYPDAPDYSAVGLASSGATLQKFALSDVTRRALNCLTLLYVTPSTSLVKENVERYQARIVTALQTPAPLAAGADGAPSRAELTAAIAKLTAQIAGLLDAWDGYLRENFFAGGALENDDLELTAYEAGRAMAWLSWGVSVKTLPTLAVGAASAEAQDAMEDDLHATWTRRFDQRDVTRLAHMLSALGGALDEAWYRAHAEIPRPGGTPGPHGFNPLLPSKALRAVEQGLEYWRRSIPWMNSDAAKLWDADFAEELQLALVAQTGIWQSLVTGRQDLTSFGAKSITEKIMKDLMADLESAAGGEIAAAGARQVEQLARQSAQALEGVLGVSQRTIVVMAGVMALALVALFSVVMYTNSDGMKSMMSGGVVSLTAVVGWLGSQRLSGKSGDAKQRMEETAGRAKADAASPEGGEALGTVKGLTAGEAVQAAFLKGYQQLRIELAELDHCVSAAYPLIELVVARAEGLQGQGAHGFLTNVIWSDAERDQELRHVALAAFGPMATFARSSVKGGTVGNGGKGS